MNPIRRQRAGDMSESRGLNFLQKPTPPLYRTTSTNFITFVAFNGLWIIVILSCTFYHQRYSSGNKFVLALSAKTQYDKLLQVKRKLAG